MAKIKNSVIPNIYGDGNEKILTTDNGEEYRISNSAIPNIYGDGQEINVKKVKSNKSNEPKSLSMIIVNLILVVIGLAGCAILVRVLEWVSNFI